VQPWDFIARAVIYGGGLFAIWAIYITIKEAIHGRR